MKTCNVGERNISRRKHHSVSGGGAEIKESNRSNSVHLPDTAIWGNYTGLYGATPLTFRVT